MQKLTVVVPAFNESEGLRDFHARLAKVLDGLDLESEVLYVDDGSRDDTYAIMCALRAQDARVSTLKLARNFGKELALTAGLDHVNADAATNVQLTSPIPAGFSFKSNSGDCTTDFPCTFPTLAPGDSVEVTTSLCLPFDYAAANLTVASSATSSTNDGNPGNNDTTGLLGVILDGFANGFDCP